VAEASAGEPLRDAPAPLPSESSPGMLFGASAAQSACSFMVLGLPAIGPELRRDFGLSLAALGALLATMQLGSGLALIAAGSAADRWGARPMIVAGTAAAALGLGIGAALHTVPALFAGLFVAGLASAIIPVAGASAIFRTYPARRRAWALGVRQMAVPAGGLIAAAAVPALNVAGGARLVLAVGAVAVAAAGTAFAAVSDDTRIRHPSSVKIIRGIWDRRVIPGLLAVSLTYLFVLQTVLSYSVPAMRAAGFSTVQAGIGYFVVNAAAIVSRLAWGRIGDRDDGTRRKRSLVETGILASMGALLFGLGLHATLPILLPILAFYAFAALGWNALMYALAGEWTTPELSGRAFSVAATITFAGSAAVNPTIGALAGWLGWNALWVITAAVALAGAAAARTLLASANDEARR
jgi:MFS family permease